VLVRTGGGEVAGAYAEGDLAQFEVVQELVPFGGGEVAVLVPGCSGSLKMLTSPDLSGVLGTDVKGPGVAGLCAFVGGGTVPMTDTQRPSR
jgi:hypothetical protein